MAQLRPGIQSLYAVLLLHFQLVFSVGRNVGLILPLVYASEICPFASRPKTYCQQITCVAPSTTLYVLPGQSVDLLVDCYSDCTELYDVTAKYSLKPTRCNQAIVQAISVEPNSQQATAKQLTEHRLKFSLVLPSDATESLVNIQIDYKAACWTLKGKQCALFDGYFRKCEAGCYKVTQKEKEQVQTQVIQVQLKTLPVCLCPSYKLGDGFCDPDCNNEECQFDGNDCKAPEDFSAKPDEDRGGQENTLLWYILCGCLGCIGLLGVFYCFSLHRVGLLCF